MNTNFNFKNFIKLISGTAIFIWCMLVIILGNGDFISLQALKLVQTAVFILIFLWFFFVRWLWKTSLFKGWLIKVPDLSGEWDGQINYKYKDQNITKKITAIIKQSFNNFSIVVSTDEMESYSYAHAFLVDNYNDIKKIAYIYTSEPDMNLRDDSPIHSGAALLSIKEDGKLLKGEYWTGRTTKGEINIRKNK